MYIILYMTDNDGKAQVREVTSCCGLFLHQVLLKQNSKKEKTTTKNKKKSNDIMRIV